MTIGSGTLHGQLRIVAAVAHGQTVLRASFCTPPFHTGRRIDRHGDGRAEIIVQSVGPGHFPGDHYDVGIRADPSATLVVRGQGANRVYPSPAGEVAKSAVTLTAGDETTLIYLPGEIIPYRTAVFEQSTIVEAAESSRVAIVEVLTPGRLASNERYAFSRLDLKTRVHVNGRLLLQDRALLEPGSKRLTSRGRAADYSVTASLILIGKRWTLPQAHPEGDVVSAAGQSDGYILVRILGPTAQQVNRLVIETICQAGFNIC